MTPSGASGVTPGRAWTALPSEAPSGTHRLLRGLRADGQPLGLAEHVAAHGPPPDAVRSGAPRPDLIDMVERSGLRGRGGAAFPMAAKMRAVLAERPAGSRRRVQYRAGPAVVVANGCEGEPASAKDGVLLDRQPHLVLDGAAIAAAAVGADRVILAAHERHLGAVRSALAERNAVRSDAVTVEVHTVADRFIAGQESALVSALDGGPGLPTLVPPRPFERGVGGRPTLVSNVESLAQLALVARHGPAWYRRAGTDDEPGTTLVTLRGTVSRPGVYEVGRGTPVTDLIAAAGGLTARPGGLLVGGYAGAWVRSTDWDVGLSEAGLRRVGGTLGAGVVVVVGSEDCGVATTARILAYLAGETAGQCGPCVHGLAAMAAAMGALAVGQARRDSVERLRSWAGQVTGRGACNHPDGAARIAASALRVFAADVDEHRQGRPCAGARQQRRAVGDDLPGLNPLVAPSGRRPLRPASEPAGARTGRRKL